MGRRAALVLLAALSLAGCSLVFAPSGYSDGDGGAPRDGSSPRDGGSRADGPRTDGGGTAGAWPTCSNGVRESAGAQDRRGSNVVVTDALHVALFASGVAADGEVGIVSDRQIPTVGQFVDVAVARGPAIGTAYVAAVTSGGSLVVHQLSLEGGLSVNGAYLVNWNGADPDSLERVAIRWTAASGLQIAVVGRPNGGWVCSLAASDLDCTPVSDAVLTSRLQTVAIANTTAGAIFLGHDTGSGYDYRPGVDADTREDAYRPRDLVGGTNGPVAFASSVDPFPAPAVYWLTATGTYLHTIGPGGGPFGVAHLAETGRSELMMVRGTQTATASFDLGARRVDCGMTGCTCPAETDTDCTLEAAFQSWSDQTGDIRFVEADRAGDAVLVVAGVGENTTSIGGTDVALYAFDIPSAGAPIPVAEGLPSIVLGSGRVAPPFVGRLVDDVGMRAVAMTGGQTVDVIEAALVDLTSGGTTTREVYVSAVRFCGAI